MALNDEKRVSLQRNRVIHAKINVLDFDFNLVEEITGVVLDGSSYTIDATSDIRRTCSITIVVKDSTFDIEYGGKIWLDKYIQIFIGIEDNSNNNEVVYSNIGIYLIDNPKQMYDAVNNTLSINGVDLMSKMTGLRNGYLEGITYQIKANTNIRNAMIAMVKTECGFKNYSIDLPHPTLVTPNDLSFGLGSTAYNIIAQLRDINSNYQTYFDTDGTFYFNRIPSGENEQIMVDDEVWQKVLISYSKETNFEEVKNYIEVFGKTQDDGHTPYGMACDTNPKSPFFIGIDKENMIRIVLSGGEYDNIFPLADYDISETQFNSLAQQRADYELYLRCKLQDTLELVCVPLYWLDVNWVINITLPNKKIDEDEPEEVESYIIKKITTTLGVNGTQNISLIKYYPLNIGSLVYNGTTSSKLANNLGRLAAASNQNYAIFSGFSTIGTAYDSYLVKHTVSTFKRYFPLGLSFGEYAIFAAGFSGTQTYHKEIWAFNNNLARTRLADLSYGMTRAIGTTLNDTINNHKYIIIANGEDTYYNADVYDENFVKINNVSNLSVNRNKGTATSTGNYAIFMGQDSTIKGGLINTVDIYDNELTHSLFELPSRNMRQGAEMCSTTVGKYALFAGGYYRNTNKKLYYSNVYTIDDQLTMKTLSQTRSSYESISATTFDNYALFTGGGKDRSSGNSMMSNKAWVISNELVKSNPSSISQARCGIASTTIGDFVLCGGGINKTIVDRSDSVKSYTMVDVYSKV